MRDSPPTHHQPPSFKRRRPRLSISLLAAVARAWARRPAGPSAVALLAAALVGVAATGCKVDRAEFNRRVFSCNTAATAPACGTDDDGRPMACFAATQIGAPNDFCARMCPVDPAKAEGLCLDSNVELRSCRPSDDVTIGDGAACNQPGLACLRTDLIEDEGVCTTLNPCGENADCRDPVRSVCATSFLHSTIYPQAAATLNLDHLFCLQTGCKARGTSCPPGESCLQDVIPAESHPPDICVPNCDSADRCPPNFLCYRKVSSDAAPNVCIPGLLGFTCSSSIDCMIGQCNDTGFGYSVCTLPCNMDADCKIFDGEQGRFLCVKNPAAPATPGWCQTPDAYRGSICNTNADCARRNGEDVCTRFKPTDEQGVCLAPCTADGKCSGRGGINHTCLPVPADINPAPAVCFPGYFGYPCGNDSNCTGDLSCSPAGAALPSICTIGCQSDADCGKPSPTGDKGNRWVNGDGFCGAVDLGLPICLPNGSLPAGTPCHTSAACESQKCTNGACGEASK